MIIFNHTIDMYSFLYGALIPILLLIFLFLRSKLKKKKYDLHNLKKIVYETGIHLKTSYENVKELEKFFNEVEDMK